MRQAVLVLAAVLASAEPTAEVFDLFREAAEALANGDSGAFLAKFDPSMPGYATLREEIVGLVAAHDAASTIDVISEDGDGQKRSLELDWTLAISERNSDSGKRETRRGVLRCRVERRGRQWRIVALDPVDFFRY